MPTLYDNFSQVRQYINQEKPDLTSYVTKTELANASYVTSDTLNSYLTVPPSIVSNPTVPYTIYRWGLSANNQYHFIYPNAISYTNIISTDTNAWASVGTVRNYVEGRIADIESSYATTTYVVDYVAAHGGGGSTVIDENIIPKENNTYTLGDVDHLYNAAYTSRVKVGNNSQIYNDGGGITFSVNNNNGIRMGGSTFYPKTNKGYSNGSSTNLWSATYQRYSYLGTGVRLYSESSDSSNDLAIDFGGVSYYFMNSTRFAPNGSDNDNKLSLGTSDRRWLNTYTTNLYADNLYTYSLTKIYSTSNYNISFNLNGTNRFQMDTIAFFPSSNNTRNLGTSALKWAATYTANLYVDNIHNFIWQGTSTEYAALSDYTTYQLYLIENE